MYTAAHLAGMRADPDRPRLLSEILDAFDRLSHPTVLAGEVVDRVRSGQLEVLFDGTMPAGGGLVPGGNPVILGGQGVLGNLGVMPDDVLGLLFSMVHEGVHHLDVVQRRVAAGPAATAEERFLTELRAYTAEYELAQDNQLGHLLAPEFRGARHLEDLAAAVLTVESYLVFSLRLTPGVEQVVIGRVGAMFPSVPRQTP